MKKITIVISAFLIALFVIAAVKEARAQLVLTNMKVKIVKVERKNNRLQVRVHEKGNTNVQYVHIDARTRFSMYNKPVSFDQAWKIFHKDQIIRVKGGYTMNFHIKARTILM